MRISVEHPEGSDWTDDKELRQRVSSDSLQLQQRTIDLLDRFYRRHTTSYGNMLHLRNLGYSYLLQSIAAETTELLDPEEQSLALFDYQCEMRDFTQFLKRKYLEE